MFRFSGCPSFIVFYLSLFNGKINDKFSRLTLNFFLIHEINFKYFLSLILLFKVQLIQL